MGVHSKFAPSGSSRRLACPGSTKLCEKMPHKDSVYAQEGTAAHTLAEWCLTQNKDAAIVAKKDFNNPILPDPSDLTLEEIAKIISVSEVINSWLDQIKVYAQNRMEKGASIPGFKLVAKQANKKWVSEDTVVQKFYSVLGDDLYEKKILSPSKLDKALIKIGFKPKERKEMLDSFWEKPDNGTTIAPNTDKRKEVIAPAEIDFLKDADFLQ